ncbi:MAG: hypothetical protein ACE5GA_03680 [Candidatus Zixiibacteriota bacterium]
MTSNHAKSMKQVDTCKPYPSFAAAALDYSQVTNNARTLSQDFRVIRALLFDM